MQKRILIAGGTGLIGKALSEAAEERGYEVVLLSRSAGEGIMQWDPEKFQIALKEPLFFDAIINLAGASIAGNRWTAKRKKLILESRLKSSATIEKYLTDGLLKTECYIGASAIGIYGQRNNDPVDENTDIDQNGDWLSSTALAWEEGHNQIKKLGIRTCVIRIGLVLSQKGGALKEMIQTAPFGILGYFGNGHQMWSWIHMEDVVRIFLHSITNQKMEGVYLATAPFPVTNKRITTEISKTYSPKRLVVPVPEIVLSLMLGEMHTILMQSCACYPERLVASGFQFSYLRIEEAVEDLMKKKE